MSYLRVITNEYINENSRLNRYDSWLKRVYIYQLNGYANRHAFIYV